MESSGRAKNGAGMDYDVVVIGSGTAGITCAHAVAAGGKRVAVVDERPFGGTCAMRGCQPKKYLVAAAEAVERAHAMAEIGVAGKVRLDWAALQRSKNAFVDAVPERTGTGLARAGIDALHGHARFAGHSSLDVDGRTVTADRVVVATGARPRPLDMPGAELLTTSDDFLDLESLPASIAFVGGGYISFEFAHVAARAGCEVTILQRGDRVLRSFESDLVDRLVEATEAAGIRVRTNAHVCGVAREGDRLQVRCEETADVEAEADLVVHGAGRTPLLDGLELAAAGVEATARGVVVDGTLRSVSNPAVLAIGDAAATPIQLATTADHEAAVAARNLLTDGHEEVDYGVVPSSVFTLPPLATVGMGEEEARSTGRDVVVNAGDMSGWPSSRRIGQTHAAYKVLIDGDSEEILGAHLLGHGAGDAINVFALAMRVGLTTADLEKVLWAYPTHVSDLKYTIR